MRVLPARRFSPPLIRILVHLSPSPPPLLQLADAFPAAPLPLLPPPSSRPSLAPRLAVTYRVVGPLVFLVVTPPAANAFSCVQLLGQVGARANERASGTGRDREGSGPERGGGLTCVRASGVCVSLCYKQ